MAWNKILSSSHNRFGLCGAYWNGKFFAAGYGAGQLVSAFPETLEINGGDEAIFDIVPFRGTLFAPSEQNSTTGTTRIWKRTEAGWVAVPIPGYATYFMTANDSGLLVSATHNILSESGSGSSIDMYGTNDGNNFFHLGNTGGWIWVPVIYKNVAYVLGHAGDVYTDGGVAAVKWNGSGWSTVTALTGFAGEWQCACEHNGYLFCGSGGWTTNRSTPGLAKLYRFDGNTATLVLTGPNHSELSAVASIDGILYAAFGSGFKYDDGGYSTPGTSEVWYSTDNGANWTQSVTLAQPNIYKFIDVPNGIALVGGGAGDMSIWLSGDQKQLTDLATPTNLAVREVDNKASITWTAPSFVEGIDGYEIEISTVDRTKESRAGTLTYFRVRGANVTSLVFTPRTAGAYRFRIRSGSGTATGPRTQEPAFITYSKWSDYTDPMYFPVWIVSLDTPPVPVATYVNAALITLTITPCTQNTAAATEIYQQIDSGEITYVTSVANSVTTASITDLLPGVAYRFYVRYHVPRMIVSLMSGPSAIINVPGTFLTPESITAQFTSPSTVLISWIDRAAGETHYEVERYNKSTNSYVKIANVAAGTTQFVDSDITLDTQVTYRLRARGGAVYSAYGYSNSAPYLPAYFTITESGFDADTAVLTLTVNTDSWLRFAGFPSYVAVQTSLDGVTFTTVDNIFASSAVLLPSTYSAKIDYSLTLTTGTNNYIKLIAVNGAGYVASNVLLKATVPPFYTAATPPVYSPGESYGESLVWGKDGAGEAGFSLTGLQRLDGYTYVATVDSIGTLTQEPTEAEIITQPLADEWYGAKTVTVVELEASTNRDINISIGSRSDYKEDDFNYRKEVPLHRTGKTGYIISGNEFETKLRWNSGVPHSLKLTGGRLWVKLTAQAMKTVPFFFGRKGYDPKGGK